MTLIDNTRPPAPDGAQTVTVDDVQLDITLEQLRRLVSPRAFTGETMLLNMGPQHPSTHGVLRLLLELDGETVVNCIPDIGYLHTGIEKTAESKTFVKAIPLTDRTDYLAPMSNNLAFCGAVEKLVEIDVPPRAQYLRVILMELTRMNSHLVWLGTHALDIGAMSVFLYAMRERELILDVYEAVSGARMMSSYIRPGGLWRDVPNSFFDLVRKILDVFPARLGEYEKLLTHNPMWKERTVGIGAIGAEDAIAWGLTGPSLRGSGVNYDARKAQPYSGYERFDFEVPTGANGDTMATYMVQVGGVRKQFATKLTGTNVVESELAADFTGSIGDPPDFRSVPNSGMGMTENSLPGHLEKKQPAGGNLVFLDGHAGWRPFRQMKPWYDANDRTVRFWF